VRERGFGRYTTSILIGRIENFALLHFQFVSIGLRALSHAKTIKTKSSKYSLSVFLFTVRERGLEPPRIAPLVPKTSAATITPLTHIIL